MALKNRLAPIVPERIRERGQMLYRQGAVYIFRGGDQEVQASVESTRLYPVSLRLDDGTLNVRCECAYFAANSMLCKHIWATILSADAAGYLNGYLDEDAGSLSFTDEELASAMDRFSRQVPALDSWERRLRAIEGPPPAPPAVPVQILYLIESQHAQATSQLVLDIVRRQPKRDGTWGKGKPVSISASAIAELPDERDRQILSMILGSTDWASSYGYYGYGRERSISGSGVIVPSSIANQVLELVAATGRARLDGSDGVPVSRDPECPWELWLEIGETERGYKVVGHLRRQGVAMELDEPAVLTEGGLLVGRDGKLAGLDDFGAFAWILSLRRHGPMSIPAGRADDFLRRVAGLPGLPRLQLPAELDFQEVQGSMSPHLRIESRVRRPWDRSVTGLTAVLSFDYGEQSFTTRERSRGYFEPDPRRLVLRDRAAEEEAVATAMGLGLRPDPEGDFLLASRILPRVVRELASRGWTVEADGRLHRSAGRAEVRLVSGIDWFDLEGSMQFGDQSVSLPELLAALRRGEDLVRLDDGTFGILPEEWLNRYAPLAGLGSVDGDALRFQRNQVGLLDVLLASQPEVDLDEAFLQARNRLWSFEGIDAVAAPAGFQGQLREYQREGLGWLRFLQEFGFGGCLADDMGLGKTIQVLALLESRRTMAAGPSLVVVPKSLVFNWLQEAARFTPELKILDHTGTSRLAPGEHFEQYDVVLTTYGTLRRDAGLLSLVTFDYAILDEAQAIKNSSTASAKAARLLRAEHRLALSGTPIENHLGELWSLFEFLNPGMLGASKAFQSTLTGRTVEPANRDALARALRPFILRRTKEQVAKELPPKTEQTQYCELSGAQHKQYEQLREHYRRELLQRVDRDGIAKSKMFVLEALLRLRQAACHPGLIDPGRSAEPSAKLDLLVPQLLEVADEGHKAIVFSQFTKMLGILKPRLDSEGVVYEYLDGRTRDRQQRVERFQNDPDCRLFLVSLKAGGLGLNLTAAEYVFLLDPWWNPAVEAQAIDRAHRIGQTMPVFAYRIIARNTVEEKVLELQDSKRALADAIIGEGNSLIRQIKREDLELLLS